MRLSVVGCGYLGAVHAACMAELGHDVVGIDVDATRIDQLSRAEAPFFEPELPELLDRGRASGRLRFTTDAAAVHGARVHFLCVGTPQRDDSGAADLSFLDAAVTALLPHLRPGDVVVGKCTVPVGTAAGLGSRISAAAPGATLVWNPEFLREGHAVADTLAPDRLVYGVDAGDDAAQAETAVRVLDEVYAAALTAETPRRLVDLPTAELVKVAANAFLATKISFVNAMSELCDAAGGDVTDLADCIGLDARIGRAFLNAGLGFGGGCLPKDIRAFRSRARELGSYDASSFLDDVDAINLRCRDRMVELALDVCEGSVRGRRVAVLGAAFKPQSDDVRDSPALEVAVRLHALGAAVVVTDPQAIGSARRTHPMLRYLKDVYAAAEGADVVLLLTEWPEYAALDPVKLGEIVGRRVLLDGRNAVDPDEWRAAGWTYRALGRR